MVPGSDEKEIEKSWHTSLLPRQTYSSDEKEIENSQKSNTNIHAFFLCSDEKEIENSPSRVYLLCIANKLRWKGDWKRRSEYIRKSLKQQLRWKGDWKFIWNLLKSQIYATAPMKRRLKITVFKEFSTDFFSSDEKEIENLYLTLFSMLDNKTMKSSDEKEIENLYLTTTYWYL